MFEVLKGRKIVSRHRNQGRAFDVADLLALRSGSRVEIRRGGRVVYSVEIPPAPRVR